jgi:non-canonical (house-cleaning) NTP pyrophosphatase
VSEVDPGARARLDYIEHQLEALFPDRYVTFAAASGTTLPPGVVELARAGKMIAAIQEYRNATGVGLKEAKIAVESLLR